MSVFISDRDTANNTSNFLDQNNPKININTSARMS